MNNLTTLNQAVEVFKKDKQNLLTLIEKALLRSGVQLIKVDRSLFALSYKIEEFEKAIKILETLGFKSKNENSYGSFYFSRKNYAYLAVSYSRITVLCGLKYSNIKEEYEAEEDRLSDILMSKHRNIETIHSTMVKENYKLLEEDNTKRVYYNGKFFVCFSLHVMRYLSFTVKCLPIF